MHKSNKLSAIILTFNEGRNIERCLKSIQGIADEVIIIDSFSTDQTEVICRNYGARFIQRKWEGYSNAKNYGNSLASYDYILSLDADEALSDELRESLLAEKKDFKSEAYSFHRLTNYCGQWIHHCGWYPDTKTRLWRKGKAEWVGLVHEQLLLNNCSVSLLKGDIHHYSYYSIKEHFQKADRYSDLIAKQNHENGKKAPFYKLALSPFVCFFKGYILQRGFLDGYYGFIICFISSFITRIKYVKTRELTKNVSLDKRIKSKFENFIIKHFELGQIYTEKLQH